MTEHADTIRRVLRGEDVPAMDKINALADIATEATHRAARLERERQQAIDALRWLVEIYETRRGDMPRSIQDTDDAILRQAIRSARAVLGAVQP